MFALLQRWPDTVMVEQYLPVKPKPRTDMVTRLLSCSWFLQKESFVAIACSAVTNCPFELAHAQFVLALPHSHCCKTISLAEKMGEDFHELKDKQRRLFRLMLMVMLRLLRLSYWLQHLFDFLFASATKCPKIPLQNLGPVWRREENSITSKIKADIPILCVSFCPFDAGSGFASCCLLLLEPCALPYASQQKKMVLSGVLCVSNAADKAVFSFCTAAVQIW